MAKSGSLNPTKKNRRHYKDTLRMTREYRLKRAFERIGWRVDIMWCAKPQWGKPPHFRVHFRGIDDDVPKDFRRDVGRCVYRFRWIIWRNRIDRAYRKLGIDSRKTCAISDKTMRVLLFRDPRLCVLAD